VNESFNEDTVKIVEPTEDVFEKASYYIELVKSTLPNASVTIIGSLAVPICIKNEIDLLVEISENEDIAEIQNKIIERNSDIFNVGLLVNGEGFNRSKKKHGLICELHILHKGDPRIIKYFDYVERLKSDAALLKRYDDLKRSLDGVPMSEYKEAKSIFFAALDKSL